MVPAPTQAGFLTFIRQNMAISTTNLPDNSVFITYAFEVAQAVVNPQLQQACYQNAQIMYVLAVYNLAADRLINFAQDIYDAPLIPNPDPNGNPAMVGCFQALRISFGINKFTAGVVSGSSDEGTSVTLAVVESLKNLTVAQLGNLKTPYGVTYLGIAQSVGTLWGLS